MKPTDKKVVWEGAITIYEQEGGYAHPSLSIAEIIPAIEIEETFEYTDKKIYGNSIMYVPGKWRLTLERIE